MLTYRVTRLLHSVKEGTPESGTFELVVAYRVNELALGEGTWTLAGLAGSGHVEVAVPEKPHEARLRRR